MTDTMYVDGIFYVRSPGHYACRPMFEEVPMHDLGCRALMSFSAPPSEQELDLFVQTGIDPVPVGRPAHAW